jgi:hypothetical protein
MSDKRTFKYILSAPSRDAFHDARRRDVPMEFSVCSQNRRTEQIVTVYVIEHRGLELCDETGRHVEQLDFSGRTDDNCDVIGRYVAGSTEEKKGELVLSKTQTQRSAAASIRA